MIPTEIVRTRFAPSPSGHLHVGGARTALFAWAFAKAHGGRFVLRIEDTDQKRSSDAASMAFLEDLRWLGIEWDEGPFFQSERREIYDSHLERLIVAEHAYRAFETPEELSAARDRSRAAGKDYRYDRAALALPPETVAAWVAEKRPHVVRLKVPREDVTVHDEILGEVVTTGDLLDDFVIRKTDGFPTYHFAVVVDDELMGVTHVIRAQEHLGNTPRHILLQRALGFRTPVYAHLALILNPDGSKMSKRDRDKALRAAVTARGPESIRGLSPERLGEWLATPERQLEMEEAEALARELAISLPEINVDDFRRAGYLPEVVVNYLTLLGWSPGGDLEKFDRAYLIEHFDLERVTKSAARFDREKLLAFNLDALQGMDDAAFAARYREHCVRYHPEFIEGLTPEQFDLLARANHSRAKTLEDTLASSEFLLRSDEEIEVEVTKATKKALTKGQPTGFDILEALRPLLAGLPDWTVESIEAGIRAWADAHAEGKLGKVGQPLRVAVCGGPVSPPIFETLAIVGRDSVLNRIDRCLAGRGRFEV